MLAKTQPLPFHILIKEYCARHCMQHMQQAHGQQRPESAAQGSSPIIRYKWPLSTGNPTTTSICCLVVMLTASFEVHSASDGLGSQDTCPGPQQATSNQRLGQYSTLGSGSGTFACSINSYRIIELGEKNTIIFDSACTSVHLTSQHVGTLLLSLSLLWWTKSWRRIQQDDF